MQILPIGGYFPKCKDGFIINPSSWHKVPTQSQQLIHKLLENIPEDEKSQLDSIYLRGSLPRGIEEKYIDDIDLFALTKKKGMRWMNERWMQELILETSAKETNFPKFEFISTSFDDRLIENYSQLAAIIKTQSVCIYGPDFSKKLPKFKPGKSMLLNYRWLKSDLQNALTNIATLNDKKDVLKTLIRTGFEMVMEREEKYTPDLYWCCQSFSIWYPLLADQMTKALQFYLNPKENEAAIDSFLQDFGPQIVKESLKYSE